MEEMSGTKTLSTKLFRSRNRAAGAHESAVGHEYSLDPRMAEKLWATLRIVFGAVFFADGMLKWVLLAQGNLQATVQTMYFTSPGMMANWFLLGVLVGLGETFGGLFLMLGVFQRPAALWSAAIMLVIYVFGGFDGWYLGAAGKIDVGGDLTLVLVFLLLALVVPTRYGLSSYLRLPERLAPGPSLFHRLVRAFVA